MRREHHIPLGPLLASVGALVLLVSLFLDWYEQVTGWTVFELADLLLAGLALWALFGLAGALGLVKAPDAAALVLAPALLALVVVVTQILNDPPAVAGPAGPEKDIGIWLALGGAGLMALGAVLATTHIALFVEAREGSPFPTAATGIREPPPGPESSSPKPPAVPSGPEPTLYVAVAGPSDASAEVAAAAETIGRGLAARGAVVVCGGLGGAMEAACRGAKAAGGTTVGLLPGGDRAAANPFIDVAVATGWARPETYCWCGPPTW